MKIKLASPDHLEQLVQLFNDYRIFYKQDPDKKAAKRFLMDRFLNKDSVLIMAFNEQDIALGFMQLYPIFSSVSMQRSYILNDLYVDSTQRGNGIGEALMTFAKQFAITNQSKGLTLETAINNPAQKLYERLGWKKDTDVLHYTWEV